MAFKYYSGGSPLKGLDYSGLGPSEQPTQQQPQVDPGMVMNILQQTGVMGGQSGVTGGGGGGNLWGANSGTKMGSMWGKMGKGISSVAGNPWAWLAMAIIGNEAYAKHRGYRSKSKSKYARDLLSGEVFHQDLENRFLPKLGLKKGSSMNKAISFLSNPMGGTLDPAKTIKRFRDIF